jgi:hypothetical protein
MGRVNTLDLDSLLSNQAAFQTVQVYGIDRFAAIILQDLQAHDANLRDALAEIAEPTTERLWASAGTDSMEMFEADEYSRVPTQRITAGYNFGAPLRKRQISVGWTAEYFKRKTVAEFAAQYNAAKRAHVGMVLRDLRRSIWLSTNYTFAEKYQDPLISIAVKRLVNADSLAIPPGPNGEVFDSSTHTHYLANATLTDAIALSMVNTVLEHRVTGGVRVVIAQADRAAWEALTSFTAYPDPRLQFVATTSGGVPKQTIRLDTMNDLAIGMFGPAEVWVKPWGISNYPLAYDVSGPKPVVYRFREGDLALQTAAQNDAFPLHADFLESHYGFAIRNRIGAAVLDNGHASYTDPTIN